MSSRLKLIFFGTDGFAEVILRRLFEDPRFEISAVVTVPDQPMGRRKETLSSQVKRFSLDHGLTVFHTPEAVKKCPCDFIVVASYGRILQTSLLSLPKVASVNVHPSLLPRHRGSSPIQAALLAGDSVTGVCVIRMDSRVDAGPIYALSEVAIAPTDDAVSLRAKLASTGAELLAQTLPGIFSGDIEPQVQDDSKATYCPKIERESGELQWLTEDAVTMERRRRAYTPWPGLYTTFEGRRLKILSGFASHQASALPGQVVRVGPHIGVGTTRGIFVLDQVQWDGKSPCSIESFVRGHPEFLQHIF